MDQCLALCRARAIENQCFLVLSNRCGTDESLAFGGESAIASPTGELLQKASSGEETLLVEELDIEMVKEVRRSMKCLEDRRPRECYDASEFIDLS
jgi:predicted amidohydrolase